MIRRIAIAKIKTAIGTIMVTIIIRMATITMVNGTKIEDETRSVKIINKHEAQGVAATTHITITIIGMRSEKETDT